MCLCLYVCCRVYCWVITKFACLYLCVCVSMCVSVCMYASIYAPGSVWQVSATLCWYSVRLSAIIKFCFTPTVSYDLPTLVMLSQLSCIHSSTGQRSPCYLYTNPSVCLSLTNSSSSSSWREAISRSIPPLRFVAKTICPQPAREHQSPLFPCPGGSDGSMWWEVDLEHASSWVMAGHRLELGLTNWLCIIYR